MSLIVVALGGNALAPKGKMTVAGQFQQATVALKAILPLVRNHHVILTHGNGPQVGNILIRVEESLGKAYPIPLSVAVAESEGEMGYIIEQTLTNILRKHRIARPAVSVLTQVLVDRTDPAFKKPTKPIGPFYTKKEAAAMHRSGIPVAHEPGKGYRRVVASPHPRRIIEGDTIRSIARHTVVIAAGGGGIPVIKRASGYHGVDAVIDKDRASACLALSVRAKTLLILTDVPCAYMDFMTRRQKPLGRLSIKKARRLVAEGHFAPGSMLPKMEAAIEFAAAGGTAIITNAANTRKALAGTAGTIIRK